MKILAEKSKVENVIADWRKPSYLKLDSKTEDTVIDREIFGLQFVRTCEACPEQYDIYWEDLYVGYARLRHGFFRIDAPGCGLETVYHAHPRGDGIFSDEDERVEHLTCGAVELIKFYNRFKDRPSHWDEVEGYPSADWRAEVADDNTRLGYADWVQHQKDQKEVEATEQELGDGDDDVCEI